MSAISIPRRFVEYRASGPHGVSLHDAKGRIKSRGRRETFFGGIFGFGFGMMFVAIPFTSDALAFGAIGTLLAGLVECAIIAGAFAALTAAMFADNVRGGSTARYGRALDAGRRTGVDSSPTKWPAPWAHPAQKDMQSYLEAPDEIATPAFSPPDAAFRTSNIAAQQNANPGL